MKIISPALLILVLCCSTAHAGLFGCTWEGKNSQEYNVPLQGNLDLGTLYVPRDAPIGSVIGPDWTLIPVNTTPVPGLQRLICGLSAPINATLSGKPVTGNFATAGNRVPAGNIYQTNIPGVGIAFMADVDWYLASVTSGKTPFFPFGVKTFITGGWTNEGFLRVKTLLIKTGPVSPGTHALTSSAKFEGSSKLPVIQTMNVNATIVQSQCSIPASSKAITVPMGDVSIMDLKTQNDPPSNYQPFDIPLTDCITGSYPKVSGNYFSDSFVNITLQGNAGSAVVDSGNGILGLNSYSTAQGVAVQILQQDGVKPQVLNSATPVMKVTNGQMNLRFNARYVKTSQTPVAGTANASATFTLSYK